MAVAARPVARRQRSASRILLREPVGGIALVAAATVFLWFWLGRTLVDYDIGWALVWGRELAHGHLPEYASPGAPTPHLLDLTVAALVSPLGAEGAYAAMLLAVYVGFAALVWGVFRLGQTAFSWPVGAAAAVVVATSYEIVRQTASGFFDVPVAALVVWAAVLETRSPRRGTPVLVLLAFAGLQRPEVWLLSGAYWLYSVPGLSWPARLRLAAVAAAAPVVWVLADLIITGELLHSYARTRDNAHLVQGGASLPGLLRDILRLPVLAGAIAGVGLALWFQRARAAVPVAFAALSVVSVGILGAVGLALLSRWAFTPAAALGVMFGFAVMGWTLEEPGRLRTVWALAGVLGVLLVLVSGRPHFKSIIALPEDRDGPSRAEGDLRSLARGDETGSLLRRCNRVVVPTGVLRPFVAYDTERPIEEIASPGNGEKPSGSVVFIEPVSADAREIQRIGVFARWSTSRPPSGLKYAAGNRSWRLYTSASGCA